MALSTDGRWVAWVDQTQEKPRVIIADVGARKVQRILALPERLKVRGLAWADGGTLLVAFSQTSITLVAKQASREYFMTIAYDVGGGEGRLLPDKSALESAFARVILLHSTKPHTVMMASGRILMEVDTDTGAGPIVKFGADHTVGWAVDRTGRPVAREDWDWIKGAYRVYALEGEHLREILRQDDKEQPLVVGLLPDGSALVLLANRGRPYRAAWAVPLDGSPIHLLAEEPGADIGATLTDPYSGAIIGVLVEGATNTIHWLDPLAQQRFDRVQRAFPGKTVGIYNWTADGQRVLARVDSASTPPVYYLVDFATHRADIVAEEYPRLSGVTLGEFRELTYKARDGTDIPAYLTLPPRKGDEPVPMVVLPHGGPQARDFPDFDWLVQFLASRGYAVLQPQFRGSTGFGEGFEKAGFRQWGGLMQDDVTDGVRAMIDQKIADPHHVAIVGMSYGGYAALAGAAFTPELYSCAVSINGVSDLPRLLDEKAPSMIGSMRIYSNIQDVMEERIGKRTDSKLSARSPVNAAANFRAPVLILYGSGDGVVANDQSERMAKALTAANKPVTIVKLPDEDHWLSRSDTRLQMLTEIERFLKDHL
ncbi:MAG: S9 family peptidase [Proteobacteria bacterium]|nr:S9 family peptidase [Pseudomonadota bacterium]